MSEAIFQRLEALTARLESAAAHLHSSVAARAHGHASGAGDDDVSPARAAWTELQNNELKAFVDVANKQAETKPLGEFAKHAFGHVATVLAAAAVSKKPDNNELIPFLQPIVDVFQNSAKFDNRSAYINHQRAFNEGIQSVNWLTVAPPNGLPKEVAQSGVEAADFYLNKVLKDGRTKGGAEGDNWVAFASTFKTLLQKQTQFVVEYFKTGLDWNPRGNPLSSFSGAPSAPPAAPGAPAPPAPPAPSSDASSGSSSSGSSGMGAVFAQLGSSNVTAGLRKVTADMKTKNMANVPALEPKKPAGASASKPVAAAAPPAASAIKKEPKKYESKGTWFVENYEGGEVVVNDVQLKENVYIVKCKNTVIRIPDKCKSIQVDGCSRVEVEFKSVVSIFEVFNSQRVALHCNDFVPSVAIDKSSGCSINLSRSAVAQPPQMITSSVSELNLVVPGKTDEDDPIEIPLPEQYLTVYKDGKLHTEAVAHSAN